MIIIHEQNFTSFWYRLVRYDGTECSAMVVPIHALQWYRFADTVNYGFGDVEETGILIAIDEILEEKRVRHINSFIEEHPEALKITSGANNVIYKEKDI